MCLADFCDILRCSAQVKAKASQIFFACLNFSALGPPIELDCSFAVWIVFAASIVSQKTMASSSATREQQPPGLHCKTKTNTKAKRKTERERNRETAVGILKMT